MTDPLSLSSRMDTEGGVVRVTLAGEIDVANVAGLDELLVDAVDRAAVEIVVDLRDVSFLDSSGLRSLLSAHARGVQTGKVVRVGEVSSTVAKMLRITDTASTLGLEVEL
jgi:anti-anti-sigma factor